MNTHFDSIHKRWDGNPDTLVYNPDLQHHVYVPPDDGEAINFEWHFARGILSKQMSGYEIAEFVLKEMQAIVGQGLLDGHPRIHAEFQAMFIKLATEPKSVLDELLPWIKIKWREHDDDIIFLSLYDRTPQQVKKKVYV